MQLEGVSERHCAMFTWFFFDISQVRLTQVHTTQGGLSGFVFFVHLSAMSWFHSPPLCDDFLFRCDFGPGYFGRIGGNPGVSLF